MEKMNYNQCLVCEVHNPGKTIKTSGSAFLLSDGPFAHLQMDFIWLSPSVERQYVLVCMFSAYRFPTFIPRRKADPITAVRSW